MKKFKLKKKSHLVILMFILCFIGIFFSTFNIIMWILDNHQTENETKQINQLIKVYEKEDTPNTVKINNAIKKDDLYWKYINYKLINVDFNELEKENSDTVGWIELLGTNINYPFVQTTDNEYYLSKSFYKNNNNAGWVFLDYRNNINELDKNTIIYAHGRVNGTMFGSLKNILTSNWLKNDNNFVVKLSTKSQNTLWQVFSVYKIPTTNDYIQVHFSSNDEFLNLANTLIQRSQYNFNTNITKDDKILTLSTCYNEDEKVVLHAKLIKYEKK